MSNRWRVIFAVMPPAVFWQIRSLWSLPWLIIHTRGCSFRGESQSILITRRCYIRESNYSLTPRSILQGFCTHSRTGTESRKFSVTWWTCSHVKSKWATHWPFCFRSHTVSKCPLCGLFSITVSHFCACFGDPTI